MTWKDLVREEAAKLGAPTPDDEEADYILWEHTGFPWFWIGSPIECCRRQVREYYYGIQAEPSEWMAL